MKTIAALGWIVAILEATTVIILSMRVEHHIVTAGGIFVVLAALYILWTIWRIP